MSLNNETAVRGPVTSFTVDGFRSLNNFKISLTSGLNVLVGINGSGKTNFIEFLDFVSSVIGSGASIAVSNTGGIARVFSTETVAKKNRKLRFKMTAVVDFTDSPVGVDDERVFNFEHEVEIRFSRADSAIFISKEILKVSKLYALGGTRPVNFLGSISITRKSSHEEDKPGIIVSPELQKNTSYNPFTMHNRFVSDAHKDLKERLSYLPRLSTDQSLLSMRPTLAALEAMRFIYMRGGSFNIIPSNARQSEDLTRYPYIERNGAGLAATLYAMQSAGKGPDRSKNLSKRFMKDSLSRVEDLTRLVFPDLQKIEVSPDHHTGKFQCTLHIGEPAIKVPLQAVSDGTVKWLCLISSLLSGGNSFRPNYGGTTSIEEPENFLHPRMQQYLVQIIRDNLGDRRLGYFIISTHSESLINSCEVNELILFEFVDGRTRAGRIKRPELVQSEINRTGFGLGYYYAGDSLS